jgi:hypothetical protein
MKITSKSGFNIWLIVGASFCVIMLISCILGIAVSGYFMIGCAFALIVVGVSAYFYYQNVKMTGHMGGYGYDSDSSIFSDSSASSY